MSDKSYAEQLQSDHYDSIAAQYAAHYGDYYSLKYRDRFINEPMLEGIDLSGARVVDALCGSGETTGYLLKQGAEVTGIDISREVIENYRRFYPQAKGKVASVFSTGLESDYYDCVVIVGGLHHLHPHLHEAIGEIHRILKVGGYFCFAEPHGGSLPDRIRQLWYRYDKLFAENEAAIDLPALKSELATQFQFVKEEYKGNIAYLLVLNSLVFRIPLRAKPFYSSFLMKIESVLEKMQGNSLSCFVVCQWKKVQS